MKIALANIKGGVGKSTISILFADYLAELGYDLMLVDFDRQRSSSNERIKDQSIYDNEFPYHVQALDIENFEEVQKLMQLPMQKEQFLILDTPGTVNEDALAWIYSQCDYLLIPFQYESKCLDSTGSFISLVGLIRENITSNVKLIFIPNRFNLKVGTKEEKQLWEETDSVFHNVGLLAPPIKNSVAVTRSNTISLTSEQRDIVSPAFDYILKQMFGNDVKKIKKNY